MINPIASSKSERWEGTASVINRPGAVNRQIGVCWFEWWSPQRAVVGGEPTWECNADAGSWQLAGALFRVVWWCRCRLPCAAGPGRTRAGNNGPNGIKLLFNETKPINGIPLSTVWRAVKRPRQAVVLVDSDPLSRTEFATPDV
jgi:hypothetical protein